MRKGTRRHMSDTCFQQSDGCKNILTQGIGKMDAEILRTRQNSENCPLEKFTSQTCGYDDQTHVCMVGIRKHMSDTCFEPSDWYKNILTQVIGKMDTENLRKRKNSENCPSEIFTCQICGYGDQTHVCMVWHT